MKAEYNRKESILSTRVRHASVNYVKTGLDEEHGGPGQLRFHFPQAPRQSRPKDCLKRALELIDYEACLKEQEATRNIDIVSRRSQSICCGGTLLSGLCRGPL